MPTKNFESEYLTLKGVRENNLQGIDLSFKHDQLVVITGPSGSGKSTLAINTIYAEGGRRYIETFSPYTRQFLDRLHKPDLDSISGVRPALALEQRNRTTSSRSTVGTSTEINDYLKVIWAHLAEIICPKCKIKVENDTPLATFKSISQQIIKLNCGNILLTFPLQLSTKATLKSIIEILSAQGFTRAYSRNTHSVKRLEELTAEDFSPETKPELLIIVDRIRIAPNKNEISKDNRDRLLSGINQAFTIGRGTLTAILESAEKTKPHFLTFRETLACDSCGEIFKKATPAIFSFNSPLGACSKCNGFGKILLPDIERCIPDPEKSIAQGAIVCWSTPATANLFKRLKAFCAEKNINLNTPWSILPQVKRELIINGGKSEARFPGLLAWFDKLQQKRHKMHVRVLLSRYRSEFTCPGCLGCRLSSPALNFFVKSHSLPSIWQMPLIDALDFFEQLELPDQVGPLIEIAIQEVKSRLSYLCEIGLEYLTLDRQSKTLSGGESQRVNLTSILGSRLVNTMLILDEPTIGLHASDTSRLINSMYALRDRGNTVIVIEHDTEVIKSADEIVDIGPLSGRNGGKVVFQGQQDKIVDISESLTGQYISGKKTISRAKLTDFYNPDNNLKINGAKAHNLKNIDIEIPLSAFVVLTGVSGSGKSTLISKCLYEPFHHRGIWSKVNHSADIATETRPLDSLEIPDCLTDIVMIDQSPVGKTPRANAATYSGAWDIIRECLASSPGAEQLGLSKSAFSFNVDGGRCPACKGAGCLRVEMQFLADVFVECETCSGKRFQDKVIGVHYGGKNVIDFLQMSLDETTAFFRSLGEDAQARRVVELFQPLLDLGLGYLRLGQPLSELSGGEAQRLKLATYLSEKNSEKYLFILDEPTTGLHPHNISSLLRSFDKLLEKGHSILCVEHNLDVIEAADWIIDLGPGGGDKGGELLFAGTPEKIAQNSKFVKISKTAALLYSKQIAKRGANQISKLSTFTPTARIKKLSSNSKKEITIIGARHHNLKNISVKIPHNQLSVITGVSGSGKSSLAFDILFAEGQRRYIDCLSPYARQYIKQLNRADVDLVTCLPPTIAISQKTSPPLGVSTIATTTELYQYLRLLFSKVGQQLCPVDNTPIAGFTVESVAEEINKRYGKERVFFFAPVISGRKGYYNDLFQRALKAEITEARIDGRIVSLFPELRLERHKLHWISLLVGSVNSPNSNTGLLTEAIEHALLLGGGTLEVATGSKHGEPITFSTERVCPTCKRGFSALDPQDFSFRSSRGICKLCSGRGLITKGNPAKGKQQNSICPECSGARISALGRNVLFQGKAIYELTQLNAPQLLTFLNEAALPERLNPIIKPIMHELCSRLKIICDIGLDYLELNRDAFSISGGEAQRLRLAKTLGSPLSGVCYVLDEPSIGLHPQDHDQLMQTLFSLRDSGNTVVVVEHDEDTIRQADYIIDIGPKGGLDGGEVVAVGTVDDIENSSKSLTGIALRNKRLAPTRLLSQGKVVKNKPQNILKLSAATTNNLKNVSCEFLLGRLNVVAGVSGAGKSSLIHGTLVPAIVEVLSKSKLSASQRTWEKLENHQQINRFIEIDQSPVAKTITSAPASFLGIFDEIRKLFASTIEAKAAGWNSNHFSFNTGKGRCQECSGRGFLRVPMSFLPEAMVTCESCNGLRYNEHTLEVIYQGYSIGKLLQTTMSEAKDILTNHKLIKRTLEYVHDLGLGYLTLGQPTYTLSGGEAQRLKIARELGLREAIDTLYVLDEPSIGLHMSDVDKLLNVINKLIEKGNTVVIIEHNLDFIAAADHLIELGPGPGKRGGRILFSGHPAELIKSKIDTPTKRFLLPSNPPENSRKCINKMN